MKYRRLRTAGVALVAVAAVVLSISVAAGASAADDTAVPQWMTDQRDHCAQQVATDTAAGDLNAAAWAANCKRSAELAIAAWVAEHPTPTPTTSAPATTPPVTASPTVTATGTGTPTPSPTSTAPAPPGGWTPPTQATSGVPVGWVPTTTRGSWAINTAGTYTDVRVNGDVNVNVPGVTLRRVEVIGGSINNETATGCNTLTLDQVTVRTPNGQPGGSPNGAIGPGGYTAIRVNILDTIEGFRVGGKSVGCGPVFISDSYARVKDGGNCDLHADGLQGYDGNALTLRRTTLYFAATCGTAAYFYPSNQGNTSADVQQVYVWGPGVGFTFRMGTPGRATGVLIGSQWVYGPIDVRCSLLTAWEAQIVTVGANGQPSAVLRSQPCNTETG